MTCDELYTLLKKIENILNNRPLTHIYDSEINQPLTPNHLIYGRKIETTVKDNIDSTEEIECDTIKRSLNYFWDQWNKEYITSLRERSYKRKYVDPKTNTVNVGDVCIIDETGPRAKWKIGKNRRID